MFDDNDSKQEDETNMLLRKQREKFILIIFIVAIISAVASSEFTIQYYNNFIKLEKPETSENAKVTTDSIARSLKSFRDVIDSYYIGEIDEQKIVDETIKGYVKGLDDEYSEYMTAQEWEDFQADALGNYVGIGIYMGSDKNGNVVIVAPIEGTPAEEAGLESGDIIVYVNDENVLGMTPTEVSDRVKGEEGTEVKIVVFRGSE